MAESALLSACLERLQWAENQRFCYYERLNSGKLFAKYIDKHGKEHGRAIKLCRQGTADVIVIQRNGHDHTCIVTFLETKAKKGRQTKDQREFQERVEKQGCRYILVKTVDQLEELWS